MLFETSGAFLALTWIGGLALGALGVVITFGIQKWFRPRKLARVIQLRFPERA